MESKTLAALLSSTVSQLLLLLLLLFPSSSTSLSNVNSREFGSYDNLFSLIHHMLSAHDTVASLSLLSLSKKRKRTHSTDSDSETSHQDGELEFGTRLIELNRVVVNPDSFKTFFKMRSSTFEWLSGLLEPLLDCRDPIGTPINLSAELRLGVGLFRLATGSDYKEIAQRFGVSESVTRFCAKQLCRVLCTNFRFWVAFPTPFELESLSKDCETLTGLPNCWGVIACTRFNYIKKLDRESVGSDTVQNDGSIAVQIIVDSCLRILSVAAGFKGDKSDFTVLKSTTLYKDIEEGKLLNSNSTNVSGVDVNQYLIGHGDYPLLPWLMVPFVDVVPGSGEDKFNAANKLACRSVARTIASLKNWGVLSKPIDEEFKTAVAFIGACSIFHNVLLIREDDSALLDAEDCSVYDNKGVKFYEDSVMQKAVDTRNALASRVTEFHKSLQAHNK